MRGLKGKVALVAGAAPGNIGAATAIRLAEEGTSVVAADLNESAARAVADEIEALGGKAIARSFDITDEASYKELVDVTVKEFGRLDGLFNVAADLSPATLSQDTDVLSVRLRCGGTPSTSPHRLHVRHPPRAADHDRPGRRRHRQHDVDQGVDG